MAIRVEIERKFPIRNTRNVPNRRCMISHHATLVEAKAEISDLIAADAFSYGAVLGVRFFDADHFNADPLIAKPFAEFKTVDEAAA